MPSNKLEIMTNREIARAFQYLGNIMELHGENKFKIRSYQNAYIQLRKQPEPLSEMSQEEIGGLKGIGKAISAKIKELVETGTLETIKKYEDITPTGIRQMLQIKGFGPKKIRVIWKEMNVETIGELLYACNENRLIELKGFGEKTQLDLKQKLEYFQKSQDKFHYASLEQESEEIIIYLKDKLPNARIELTGAMRRRSNIVEKIDVLIGFEGDIEHCFDDENLKRVEVSKTFTFAKSKNDLPVYLYICSPSEFGSKQFRYSANEPFMGAFLKLNEGLDFKNLSDENEVFQKAQLPFIEPELREGDWAIDLAKSNELPILIEEADIKGVVHNHSTYSDGLQSMKEMALYAKSLGYEYFVMSDHSKSAFYANGLKEDRLYQQWAEIDGLNKELAPFKIFKSIESDILANGSLDYEEDILKQFDLIIASVHSNLRMDKEKATTRLLRAIKNPYTTILGHPTGRLLLSREGYPIDHQLIIDACAANGVSIELNANPYRLDLDWTWIPYAMEKGVLISINPDAHSTGGIHDIHYGVLSARKGGLTKAACLNAKGLLDFEQYLK